MDKIDKYKYLPDVLVICLYFLLGKFAFSLSVSNNIVTNVAFFPEGVALGFAILFGPRIGISIFIGQLLLALDGGLNVFSAIGVSLSNAAISVLGAFLFRKFRLNSNLSETKDIIGILILSHIVLQPMSSFFGHIAISVGSQLQLDNIGISLFNWWMGNSIGQTLLAPVILLSYHVLKGNISVKKKYVFIIPALSCLFTYIVFRYSYFIPSDYHFLIFIALFPFYIYIGTNYNLLVVTLALTITTVVSFYMTAQGYGPYSNQNSFANLVNLDFLMMSVTISTYILTSLIERKRIDQSLIQQNELLFKSIFENAISAIAFVDCEGKIIQANTAFLEITGCTMEEIESTILCDIVACQKYRNEYVLPRSKTTNMRYKKRFESEIINKTGALVWGDISVSEIMEDTARQPNYVITINDITKQKKAVESIKESEEQLKIAVETKNKMFSIIGHDLRGPIGGFKTFVDLLLSDFDLSDTRTLKRILTNIQSTISTTYELLENLLVWAKQQQNKILFNPATYRINQIVETNIEIIADLATKKHLSIQFWPPANEKVFCDINMLDTVIRNLISNAIKFSHIGGKITIEVSILNDDFLKISITDSGIGMDNSQIESILRSEKQVSHRGTNNEKGSGLGLVLCKEFIRKNGGELFIRSDQGKGSVFSFTIPRHSL